MYPPSTRGDKASVPGSYEAGTLHCDVRVLEVQEQLKFHGCRRETLEEKTSLWSALHPLSSLQCGPGGPDPEPRKGEWDHPELGRRSGPSK